MELAPSKYGKFEVKSAAEALTWGYLWLLYSKGGGGKTTLAGGVADSPEDCPVLFIDAEGGTKAIAHRAGVEVILVSTWDEMLDLTRTIITDPDLKWKTIVIDNLSELVQYAIIKIVGNANDNISQPKWGDMARAVEAMVRDYRDLARKRNINVILLGWDIIDEDRAKRAVLTLQSSPMLQKDLPGIIDIIAHIDPIDGDQTKRTLVMETAAQTISKFRRNATGTALTIPHRITYGLNNLPMADILGALKWGRPFDEKKYPKLNQATR